MNLNLETDGTPSPVSRSSGSFSGTPVPGTPSRDALRNSGSFSGTPGTPPRVSRQGSFFRADFGQKIDLCARLREILINYPSGTTILKEFVQNADDAGGSSVRFCMDERTFPTESLADEKLAEFQGPSMLIYNSGVFSDDDFESIQRIGDSLKKEKLAQIGKFGIGFNSCYHLTEMPSFLSRSHLVMFDPQAKYIPEINPANPGKIVDILDEEVQELFPDQLAPFRAFGLNFEEEFNGTIFRLPLRTALQAESSRLTQQVHTVSSLLDLIRKFKDDAQHCLLFLKNVTSIEASVWRQDQNEPEVLWKVHVENESPELTAARSLIPVSVTESQKAAKETNKLDYESAESDYEMHISVQSFGDGATTQTNKWAICATCQDAQGQAGKMACDPGSFSLKLVPWAGVATMFETSGQDEPDAITGRPFCFLPLPAETGLPVHVHGFFELSSNRRDIWRGEDVSGEGLIRVEWNKALLESIIAPTYARLLLRLTKLATPSNLSRYYALWPWDSVAEPWTIVVRELYAHAGKLPILYSAVDGGRWVCPQDARYVPETWRYAKELKTVLLDAGQAIVEVPARLRRTLAAFSLPLADVSPKWVRELLVQKGRPQIVERDRKVGLRLLEYCLSDLRSFSEANSEGGLKYAELQGLPLAPMADGTWKAFGKRDDEEKLLVENGEEEGLLLEGVSAKMLDCKEVSAGVLEHVRCEAMAAHTNLEALTPTMLCDLISSLLPQEWKDVDEVAWTAGRDGHPSEEWVRKLWKFFSGKRAVAVGLNGWPLVPTLEGSLCKMSEQQSRVIDGATVFGVGLGRTLHKLGARILNFDLVPKSTDNISSDTIRGYVQQPTLHGVLEALKSANGGSLDPLTEILEKKATSQEKKEFRAFLMDSQWMWPSNCSGEDAKAILALPVHDVHGVDFSFTFAFSTPITTQKLPPVGGMTELMTQDYIKSEAQVDLDHYKFLGVPTETLADWYTNAVFPRLDSIDPKLCEKAMLAMLRQLPQLCAEDAGFWDRLADLAFVTSSAGALLRPRDMYDPNTPGLPAPFFSDDAQMFPAESFLRPDLVATLVRLGLRTSLDRDGVISAAGAVQERLCEEMMLIMIPTVQRTAVSVEVNAPTSPAQLQGSV